MPYVHGLEITPPPLQPRPWGRFVDVVPDITDQLTDKDDNTGETVNRTARGAKFMAEGNLTPIVADYSCGVDDDKSTGNLALTETSAAAFLSYNLFRCSTLSGDLTPAEEMVDRDFRSTISEALTYAAINELTASHLALNSDSTALPGATTLVDLIGSVEMALADRISNQRGYIFISPRYLAAAKSAAVVKVAEEDGKMVLVSPAGHWVISDAGHRSPNQNIVYGTAGLGYATSDDINLGGGDYMDRTRNIVTWLKENYGLVVFNPNWSVRASLTGGVSG